MEFCCCHIVVWLVSAAPSLTIHFLPGHKASPGKSIYSSFHFSKVLPSSHIREAASVDFECFQIKLILMSK